MVHITSPLILSLLVADFCHLLIANSLDPAEKANFDKKYKIRNYEKMTQQRANTIDRKQNINLTACVVDTQQNHLK